jgi:predicted AlkP superfamily phosphohydrolase/phosphomutase
MKILVIGLDCAAPEILLKDERLGNIRRLMEGGCYGRLESVIPPITVPAWMCMSTSQDPGTLGVYGFRNRSDHSYGGLRIANSKSIQELAPSSSAYRRRIRLARSTGSVWAAS